MAITRDAILNTVDGTESSTSTTTLAVTAAAAAAPLTEIVLAIQSFGTMTISGIADDGSGYAWSQLGTTVTDANNRKLQWWGTYATSGLASGKIITITFSAAITFKWAGAVSYLGVVNASPLDVSGTLTANDQQSWVGASVTTLNANDLILGFAANGGGTPSSTPDSPWFRL